MKHIDVFFKIAILYIIEVMLIFLMLFSMQLLNINSAVITICALYIVNLWIYDYNIFNRIK